MLSSGLIRPMFRRRPKAWQLFEVKCVSLLFSSLSQTTKLPNQHSLSKSALFRKQTTLRRSSDSISIKPPEISESNKYDLLFKKYFPAMPSFNREMDPNFTIINAVDITMRHPILGVDVQSIVERIMRSYSKPDSRLKPMFALVTGMGRGKTRLLVELDKEFKKYDSVLSIPITYNHRWEYIIEDFPDARLNYAVSIVSRMFSMHYRLPLETVDKVVVSIVHEVGGPDSSSKALIQNSIRFLVNQLRSSGRDIKHFVLLMDESMRVEELLQVENIHGVLRDAVLNEQLMQDGEKELIVDLVMSSLDVKATGVSWSGRALIPISTCGSLQAEDVLERWVKIYIPNLHFESIGDRLKMLSLIACLSPMPRAIQFMISILESYENWRFDAPRVKALYEATITMVKVHYPSADPFMRPKYGKALLFGDRIILDDTVMTLIQNSLFTNSVEKFAPIGQDHIVPQASIVSIDALLSDEDVSEYVLVLRKTIRDLLQNLLSNDGIQKAGRSLEIVMRGLVNARLRVLIDSQSEGSVLPNTVSYQKSFTLASLLRLRSMTVLGSSVSSPLANKLESVYQISKTSRSSKNVLPRSNNYANNSDPAEVMRKFLHASSGVVLGAQHSYVELQVHSHECADGGWLLRDDTTGRSFALFVDCKSTQIVSERQNAYLEKLSNLDTAQEVDSWDRSRLPGGGSQAMQLLAVADMAQQLPASDVSEQSLAAALRKGDFVYVYLSTACENTFGIGDSILHMGSLDANRFLSFFSEIYTLHCATSKAAELERNFCFS